MAIVAESDGRVQQLLDGVERFVAAAPDGRAARYRDRIGWRPREPSSAATAPVPAHGAGQRGRARDPRRRARAPQRPPPRSGHHHRRRCQRRPPPGDGLLFRARPSEEAGYGGRAGTCAGATGDHAGRAPGRGAAPARHARPSGAVEVHPGAHVPRGSAIEAGNRIESIIRDLHRDERGRRESE